MKRKKLFLNTLILVLIFNTSSFAQQQVLFSLKAAPGTKSVHVVGDFNNWSKTKHPLTDPDGDGVWGIKISLKPGKYEYRFLINGVRWIKDPENPEWGGEFSNSIIRVKNPYSPEVVNLKPETGSIIRDIGVNISATYRAGIGNDPLDVSNSIVLLNGQKQQFSFNSRLNRIEIFPGRLKDGEYCLEIEAQDVKGNRAKKVRSYFIVNAINQPPIAEAGYTIIAKVNSTVYLNSSDCYDPDNDPIVNYDWKFIQKPEKSKAKLKDRNSPFPSFIPDKLGRYLLSLQISDGVSKSQIDTVDIYTFIERSYPVQFQLSDSAFYSLYETAIESVSVAGEFNGWSDRVNPMQDYNRDGIWTTWIDLDPGEYEYKFVVNGKYWISDPNNLRKVADGWNGFNSVIASTLNLAPVINVKATFGPGKILFDARQSYSQMGKTLEFLWFQDINNPQRFNLARQSRLSLPLPQKSGTYYFYLVVRDKYGNTAREAVALTLNNGKVRIQNFSKSPEWARDAIVYEVYLRRFHPNGNLRGLREKIPYLKSLGINCIWLMPVWEGPTAHGYGPTNFFEIEKDYGTIDDFQKFIQKAHEAGIRVILDFIANHTSDQHPYFLSAFNNPFSVFRDWYRWKKNSQGYYVYEYHNDWDTLPNLNYGNPNVRHYILKTGQFWANMGVDGFRCDVAWGVPHDFWKLFRRVLKEINPDLLLINEVLPRSPAYHKDEFDMSYDTDFYGNVLDVMESKKPLSAIHYSIEKTRKNYPRYTQDFRYLENHDMERFIAKYGLNKTKLAATLLLTIPGTPLIYYGQEIGLTEKTPEMNWNFNKDELFLFYKKLIHLRRNHPCLRRGEMIKIPTNAENEVYAYARQDENEMFLVVLNFGGEVDLCRLHFPESKFHFSAVKAVKLENVLTSEIMTRSLLKNQQIELKIKPETAYLFWLKKSIIDD